jgi:flagellar hook assembly protein FlgD
VLESVERRTRDLDGWEPSAAPRGPIALGVYDAQDRQVVALASGTGEPGTHTLDWDGRGTSGEHLGAGVYFVCLAFGERSTTQRLVLAQ